VRHERIVAEHVYPAERSEDAATPGPVAKRPLRQGIALKGSGGTP